MSFSDSVIETAWKRAEGRCECRRRSHNHPYVRCDKQLVWSNAGKDGTRGCWEAHHINANGPDTSSNCEILCCDCHSRTRSYGG